jgi:putative endopeptidase
MKKYLLLLILPLLILITAFVTIQNDPTKKVGFNLLAMDKTTNPKHDFYNYANGTWLQNNPVPETESIWGSFNVLRDQTEAILKNILEQAATDKKAPVGSIKQKIGTFYNLSMDTVRLESEGFSPILADLEKIKQLKKTEDLASITADFHSKRYSPLFSLYIMQDAKNSIKYIPYTSQSGLGLPDRDYYLKEDEKSVKIREEYIKHITRSFQLIGDSEADAQKKTQKVMEIETALAAASMTRTELRDIEKTYNKKTLTDLKEIFPAFDWETYLNIAGIKSLNELIVNQPNFFAELQKLVTKHPIEDWKIYYTWNLLRGSSSRLSSAFEKEHFYFYSTILSGVKEMKPRWQRSLTTVNEVLGEALGQLYVEKNFSPESKKRVNEMVDNLTHAFHARIMQLDWMSDSTKKKAVEKLKSFNRKLGYPDQWKDYSPLTIDDKASYLDNFLRARNFEYKRMIDKMGKPVNRDEWGMSPQTVNAYYSPLLNEIVFPAAIMQPPFFNPEADDAVNYGSMGAVIGHELSHGFDDNGSKFDGRGNLNNWWTEEDLTKFKERTTVLQEQFNKYEVESGLFLNGKLTLGENIADLGGLTVAYYAYKKSREGKKAEFIEGFTPQQRFFIGWAQVWKANMRPEYLRNMVMTNPHSPGKYRVLGPLSNMPEFYAAFNVQPGDSMYRKEEERAKIW